ncbi:hypothetical protein AX16_006424 [Volvariella volvacea WC 439]|nr:hypothetical protein AX16_006424 [Volvariella volvacea WC 439]
MCAYEWAVCRYGINRFSELHVMDWAVYASFATSTFIDFVIAIVMCFYLQTSRSGFSTTNSMIVAIMRYVVASGLATSLCSMTALITYAAMPNNLVFLGIEFLLTKLYVNSFLAMLNARQSMRDKGSDNSHSISVTRMMHIRTDPPPGTGAHAAHQNPSSDNKNTNRRDSPVPGNGRAGKAIRVDVGNAV